MNSDIRLLEPTEIWTNFANLNAVPRASKKEERVIEFIKSFGASLHLETEVDAVGNVLIRKPATAGMEDRKTVVLQSHLDMVHQKNEDTIFDFDNQGIEMYVDGDWVKAKGTTLGADNGLGVATIMAVLESKTIAHPAIEALFTIDEETGMTGAFGVQPNWLKGNILLNLDTEEDDEIGVGCAGGVDVTAHRRYQEIDTPTEVVAYEISITGLQGGHSGVEIHKGLGNANVLMNRTLYSIMKTVSFQVSNIQGGSLRNAIPRESFAVVIVSEKDKQQFEETFATIANEIQQEFVVLESNLKIDLTSHAIPTKVMREKDQYDLIKSIYAAHNGVFAMSASISDLVETSNNIAKVTVADGQITVECLTRSSKESGKQDLVNKLTATFELIGCTITTGGDYPGWTPNMESPILKVLDQIYQEMNGEKAHIAACHAGLECGILGQFYPNMDMISFGPTILGAHSPDERASISSVKKYWNFVNEILNNIPNS